MPPRVGVDGGLDSKHGLAPFEPSKANCTRYGVIDGQMDKPDANVPARSVSKTFGVEDRLTIADRR